MKTQKSIVTVNSNQRPDFTFTYCGTRPERYMSNGLGTEHYGILTNVACEEEKDENTYDWKHFYPHMDVEGWSKKELWKRVRSMCEGCTVLVGNTLYKIEKEV